MNFSEALERLKNGAFIRRSGWNRDYLYLENAMTSQGRVYEPCIVMFTAQGEHQPGWFASQADLLAEDWEAH